MTNGYCLESTQPYTLGRGSCTDKTWSTSSGCPNPCSKITATKSTGCSVPLYSFLDGKALYCANSIIANSSSSTTCAENTDPFPINPGDVITDKALLARASCTVPRLNPTSPGNDLIPASAASMPVNHGNLSNTYVAIGAGVGVPLGVIAIGAIGWALYERKKRLRLLKTYASQPVEAQQPMYQHQAQPIATQPYEMPPSSKPSHIHSSSVYIFSSGGTGGGTGWNGATFLHPFGFLRRSVSYLFSVISAYQLARVQTFDTRKLGKDMSVRCIP
ncbi:hypothetical protein MGYG_00892 [Nannizzia gypsea CBS 118893]|uniref:Uncharacterized protein n=1 Tax=Arthroderma gypseum (strain ATCC MYA-4604 / CBS 118893) TaxID=535722 RepID=E5R2H7_ARTGP|nr:hypothetical protein MGYG_00892 [Nannizzia gypsea CBS 118893]EFQ97853.1 hypothetical protein MGYG_00892 [Nannizzia gypsea CBS 118893]